MAKTYSQDLRDRVIDAVERGKMSRRAAGRHYGISESVAIKWLERVERHGSREPLGHGGHRASKLMPHRDFLKAARAEKSDLTLQALCDRLLAERGVKADTSMNELGVESRDPPVEFGPLRASVGDQKGHPWAQPFTALFVHQDAQKLLELPFACGATIPLSSRMARNWLIRAVRSPTSRSRDRCRLCMSS